MYNIEKNLRELGLTKEESLIYTSLLTGGNLNMTELSKSSGLKRSNLYNHLDKLLREDLISRTTKGKRVYYVLSNPKKLLAIQKHKLKLAEKFLPKIIAEYDKFSEKPKVRFYEGADQILSVYEEITNSFHPIYSTVSFTKFLSVFNRRDIIKLTKNIEKKGNKIRNLVEDTKDSREYASNPPFPKTEKIKFLPKNYSIDTDVLIYAKNKVAFISFPSMTATIVEDENIVNYHKMVFKDMWSRY